VLEATNLTPYIDLSKTRLLRSIDNQFKVQGTLGHRLLEAYKNLKRDYSKKPQDVPLFFLWPTFHDYYPSHGDFMKFCFKWDIYTIGELKELSKYEFKILWIEANPNDDFYIEETVELISKTLRCFRFRFKGERR
jgi:hypothetical protein